MTILGSCLCGSVRYEVDVLPTDTRHCHCSICRKLSGSAFGTYAKITIENFKWTSGYELIAVYKSSPTVGRCFCSNCGSTLGAEIDGKLSYITLGTVEGDPGVRPEMHAFVGSKSPWYTINDKLPQFEEWPD